MALGVLARWKEHPSRCASRATFLATFCVWRKNACNGVHDTARNTPDETVAVRFSADKLKEALLARDSARISQKGGADRAVPALPLVDARAALRAAPQAGRVVEAALRQLSDETSMRAYCPYPGAVSSAGAFSLMLVLDEAARARSDAERARSERDSVKEALLDILGARVGAPPPAKAATAPPKVEPVLPPKPAPPPRRHSADVHRARGAGRRARERRRSVLYKPDLGACEDARARAEAWLAALNAEAASKEGDAASKGIAAAVDDVITDENGGEAERKTGRVGRHQGGGIGRRLVVASVTNAVVATEGDSRSADGVVEATATLVADLGHHAESAGAEALILPPIAGAAKRDYPAHEAPSWSPAPPLREVNSSESQLLSPVVPPAAASPPLQDIDSGESQIWSSIAPPASAAPKTPARRRVCALPPMAMEEALDEFSIEEPIAEKKAQGVQWADGAVPVRPPRPSGFVFGGLKMRF